MNDQFARTLLIEQNQLLKQQRKYPLDYIEFNQLDEMSLADKGDETDLLKEPMEEEKMRARRTLALKNVIMRIVIENRERRERPKLRDLVEVYKQRKSENKDTSSLKEKFMLLYTQTESQQNEDKDENFNTLMDGFNRVHEQLGFQQDSLQRLITEVNRLIDRKDKNE